MNPQTGLWRVFPWDPGAAPGHPFSPSFVPRTSGQARFDLPARLSRVLYLAGSADHAVAELIHARRCRTLDERHLERAGHRLAAVEVHLPESVLGSVVDLCTPLGLEETMTRADRVASPHRATTQPIARAVWDRGHAGLRWWSQFHGDWHTTVLFADRRSVDGQGKRPKLRFSEPVPLTLESPSVVEAARVLGIERTEN